MNTRTVAAVSVILTMGASACAPMAGRTYPTYAEELNQLTEACRARGGILTPIPGATSGRPQTDYACRITGGASRLD
ncbi:hypothetical protein [Brevundimonas sp. R86498]|uniref:hypothetical protein n=1 Tax=Brevundimonas sp. R86498 TaxID=3093845 RepID=UPI0037CAB7FD